MSASRYLKPLRPGAFTGQLYQLRSSSEIQQGSLVEVNGPWDKYGRIVSSAQLPDGQYLNLIRGAKPSALDTQVAARF